MKVDFKKFEGGLPYSSELYGVYQPLLGWRSKLVKERVVSGLAGARQNYLAGLLPRFKARYTYNGLEHPEEAQFSLDLALPNVVPAGALPAVLDSAVAQRVTALIQANGPNRPSVWKRFTSTEALAQVLREVEADIREEYRQALGSQGTLPVGVSQAASPGREILTRLLQRESVSAGVLGYLNQQADGNSLMNMLQAPSATFSAQAMFDLLDMLNPAKSDLMRAVISPIGLVHLFRQYFFEFDSFLGPPVQHLWLSPGGTVELVEVSTRKTIVERITEQAFESIEKSEKSTVNQDELSEAVRTENASNTKLGVSATASFSYGAIFVSGSASVSTSFNMDQSQKEAREQTHKSLRQQTEKLSSEIRKSYKSTFRTVTETTDVNSRRYTIQNTTGQLVNYDLRRKMRQVGVQVQDYGTQLCWQTYVDDPGQELGVSMLVHVAQPADLQHYQEPQEIPQPGEFMDQSRQMTGKWQSADVWWKGGPSRYGGAFNAFLGKIELLPPKPGYIYSRNELRIVSGPNWHMIAWPKHPDETDIPLAYIMGSGGPNKLAPVLNPEYQLIPAPDNQTERSIKSLFVGTIHPENGFKDDRTYEFTLELKVFYKPSKQLLKEVAEANEKKLEEADTLKARAFQEALFKAARERIKAASNIQPRRFEELREEERIVIYRNLIRQLLEAAGVKDDDRRVRHVFAELVQSMFDVDRMLYFVAPEWWLPRSLASAQQSHQDIGLGDQQAAFTSQNVVSWGGVKGTRPDNYYITEDSTPARLGSSLGWLLQLDGDNMRNAFLNAPWVKAIVPIRPGREWKALEWLSSDTIEGSDGLDGLYEARDLAERQRIVSELKAYQWQEPALQNRYANLDPNAITLLDALRALIIRLQAKHEAGETKVADPDDSTLGYLPTDKVFEHGFDPLQGGFQAQGQEPFEIFDQWIEVLPTDQIVPVEVKYDPKTGQQI